MRHTLSAGTLLATIAPAALAHPGDHHEGWMATLVHLLTQPDHLALLLLAAGAGWAGARMLARRGDRPRR